MKSCDDCFSHVHNIETGAFIASDKINLAYLVVTIIKCLVGNIRVKRGRGKVWITICIRIIVIIIHITKMSKKTNK